MVEEKEEEEEWEDGEEEKQEEEQAETIFMYVCNREIFGTFLVYAKSRDSTPTVTHRRKETRAHPQMPVPTHAIENMAPAAPLEAELG